MFDNIGKKIKSLAEVVTTLGIVFSILAGIVNMINTGFLVGVVFMAIGILLSWISSFFIYGFGQLIENSDQMVSLLKQEKGNGASETDDTSENDSEKDSLCPNCGRKIIFGEKTEKAYCPWCTHEISIQ